MTRHTRAGRSSHPNRVTARQPQVTRSFLREQLRIRKARNQGFRHRPIATQEQGLLFRLPGELRNKIYSLVLECYDDWDLRMLPVLLCDPDSPYSLHVKDTRTDYWREVNQLKYVCRQLYFE